MRSLIKCFAKQLPGVRFLRSAWISHAKNRPARTYAQLGEDRIVIGLMSLIGIERPTYLDVGAHHPSYLSNTYELYLRGSRGVCIEPDPELYGVIRSRRPRDICLNVGVGVGPENERFGNFYIMNPRTLNTFSKEDADNSQSVGFQIERVIELPLVRMDDVMEAHFDRWPNFVSIDVEGLDLEVLRTINFNRFRPEVFCVETVEHGASHKELDTADFMRDQGYMVFADTFLNTVFVETERWKVFADRSPATIS